MARFELARSKSNGLAIHRLNHSATLSYSTYTFIMDLYNWFLITPVFPACTSYLFCKIWSFEPGQQRCYFLILSYNTCWSSVWFEMYSILMPVALTSIIEIASITHLLKRNIFKHAIVGHYAFHGGRIIFNSERQQ